MPTPVKARFPNAVGVTGTLGVLGLVGFEGLPGSVGFDGVVGPVGTIVVASGPTVELARFTVARLLVPSGSACTLSAVSVKVEPVGVFATSWLFRLTDST